MRTYATTATTHLTPSRLYATICDIGRWPEWDTEIEWTRHEGRVEPGVRFQLKPRGGPKVTLEITEASAPERFVDVARLPLARMRTSHEFRRDGDVTTVTQTITISGPLAFLWDRLVARKQAEGAGSQMQAMIAFSARTA